MSAAITIDNLVQSIHPVIKEGVIRFDPHDVRKAVSEIGARGSGLPSISTPDLVQLLGDSFTTAAAYLKKPNLRLPETIPHLRKHFIMVTPHAQLDRGNAQTRVDIMAKWEAVRRALKLSGAKVTVLDSRANDSVTDIMCRDDFTFVNGIALMAKRESIEELSKPIEVNGITTTSFSKGELKLIEEKLQHKDHIKTVLEGRDIRVQEIDYGHFDGGNTIVYPKRKIVFFGMTVADISMPDNIATFKAFEKTLKETAGEEWQAFPVPLQEMNTETMRVAEKLMRAGQFVPYHLDLGMSEPLTRGEVLMYPDITDPESYNRMKEIIGEDNIIPITREEAADGSAGCICNGNVLIMSKVSDRLRSILEDKGYTVITAKDFGLDNFSFQGAESHCYTNVIHDPGAFRATAPKSAPIVS